MNRSDRRRVYNWKVLGGRPVTTTVTRLTEMAKSRPKIPTEVETAVLTETRRRCCLCVYLDGDRSRQEVQIAHIDRDRSNNKPANLVALCLRHHNDYDTIRSQSKGITKHELIAYRDCLVLEYAERDPSSPSVSASSLPTTGETISSELYRYGVLFSSISRLLYAHDPVGLADDCPPDEYDGEAYAIIEGLRSGKCLNVDALCRRVLVEWFDETIADEFSDYDALGGDILKEWHRHTVLLQNNSPNGG